MIDGCGAEDRKTRSLEKDEAAMKYATWVVAIPVVLGLALLGSWALRPQSSVSHRSPQILRKEDTDLKGSRVKPEARVAERRWSDVGSGLGLGAQSGPEDAPDFEELLDQNREAGLSTIVAKLESSDPEKRVRAVEALEGIEVPRALYVFDRALANPDPTVRWLAFEAIAGYAGPEVVPLVAAVVHDADPALRLEALEALAGYGEEGLRAIKRELAAPDEEVRARARELLGLPPEGEVRGAS